MAATKQLPHLNGSYKTADKAHATQRGSSLERYVKRRFKANLKQYSATTATTTKKTDEKNKTTTNLLYNAASNKSNNNGSCMHNKLLRCWRFKLGVFLKRERERGSERERETERERERDRQGEMSAKTKL